jgi:hypothetical protein
MTHKTTAFYNFSLTKPVNTQQETLCILVEQLGPRIQNFRLPEGHMERF